MTTAFPQKWAILFGATEYQRLPPLRYCTNDIVEVGKVLREHLEFPEDHILEFGDGLSHPPTYTSFWDQLHQFLENPIGEDDLLLFYFSGHGFQDKRDYLLPVDSSLRTLSRTGIAVEDVIDDLKATHCKNVVSFIDACREQHSKGACHIGEQSKELMMKRDGIVSIFSCEPHELSWEIETLEHSSFTYCVLQAIRKGACTTVEELDTYLAREVPVLNKSHDKMVQKPWTVTSPLQKKDLPIFEGAGKGLMSPKQYDDWITELYELAFRTKALSMDSYGAAVELLEMAKQENLDEDQMERIGLIGQLCAGKMKPIVFAPTWKRMERGRTQTARTVKLSPRTP
jgi:hypothetical protein